MLGRVVILSGLLLSTGLATGQVSPQLQHDPNGQLGTPEGTLCQVFLTKSSFDAFNQSTGKLLKGIETFEESNVPDLGKFPLPAPLEGNVPNVDPGGIGFPTGLTEKNLLIQDNITPGFSPPAPNPSGNPQALFVVGPGFINTNSKKVGEDLEVLFGIEASLDLIFSDEAKTGVGFELSHFEGFGGAGWVVAVYDTTGNLLGKFDVADAVEPVKSFFGIWCDLPIGRINIWDPGLTPDAIDNIQMYIDQEPTCPWDCGIPQDKNVGIVDFLALLAGWAMPGPCDFDGGGVGITDFLKLLAHWGQCPTPINDECFGKIVIDRFNAGGTLEEHFDMYGATPSPDPSLCVPAPFKDIWYCLKNTTMEKKIVTLTGSVDLLAEVRAGCDCANPGPLVACGRLVAAAPTTFTMQPGDEFCIRLHNDLNLPNDQIKGNLVITNEPVPPDNLNFFLDPVLFQEALVQSGKSEKFIWNFKPDFAPPQVLIPVVSPLDINTHFVNAPGVWSDGVNNLWPPEVDNIQFAANLNPQGPFIPGQFLLYVKGGPDVLLDNNAILARIDPAGLDTSLTIFSGPPDPIDDNHTAMQLEVVSLGQPGQLAVIHVTVYDKQDAEMGKLVLTLQAGQKQFVAFMTKDPAKTIGRVDIWDVFGSEEGVSAIAAYNLQAPPQIINFFENQLEFFGALPPTKDEKFFWGFKPDNVPLGTPPILIGDPLDIFSHPVVAPGIWDNPDGTTLWPPQVDNVQFSSNLNPQGPFAPGFGMLYYKGPTPDFPLDNNALVAASFPGRPDTSLTIFSGPPAGANHTAFQFELVSATPGGVGLFHVTVYDKQDLEIGKHVVTVVPDVKVFVGLISKDPLITIGRIDIWDANGGQEGISAIAAYQDAVPIGCPGPGDCCDPAGNGTPGCDNLLCCERVCAIDPFCCDVEWDDICAGLALQFPQCQCQPPKITHDLEPCVPPDCPNPDKPIWCVYRVSAIFSDPAICQQRGIFLDAIICITPCPFPGDLVDCDPDGTGVVRFRSVDNGCVFEAMPFGGCQPCPPGSAQFRRIN